MQRSQRYMVTTFLSGFLLINSNISSAMETEGWQFKPYAGFDAQFRTLKYEAGFGDNIFKKDYPQGNGYVGVRLYDYFGFEAGYETTPTRTRTARVGFNELSLGLAPINPPELHLTKNRIKGWHTGIMGYLPVCDFFCNPVELLGYIGHVRLKTYYQDLIAFNSTGPQNIFMSGRTFVKRKSVLKLGIGAQYTFCTSGVRFMLGYENTNQFKNQRPLDPIQSQKRLSLKNSLIYSAGVFIRVP